RRRMLIARLKAFSGCPSRLAPASPPPWAGLRTTTNRGAEALGGACAATGGQITRSAVADQASLAARAKRRTLRDARIGDNPGLKIETWGTRGRVIPEIRVGTWDA